MVREIVWNRRALNNFNHIVDYLFQEWGETVTKNFVERFYNIVELIVQNPEMGKIEVPEKEIRAFVVTKHNTLFYRFDDKNVILLNVFDNRQSPSRKAY